MAFDIFILAILVFTTIRGATKGVAWQLAGIGALVLCFLFATPLSLTIAPMIKLAPPLNRWVAMLAIYLVFSFGTFAVARGFREALEKAKFVEFDRHLGALFGLAKGAIAALVITFFAVAMSERARDYVLHTHTGFAAAHIMNALDPVMPRELHAILEPYIHELDAVDPELKRRREERHQELGDLNDLHDHEDDFHEEPSDIGYRPDPRDESEVSDVYRDPFQPSRSTPPSYTGPARPRATPAKPADSEELSLTGEAQKFLESLPDLARQWAPAVKQQVLKTFQNTLEEHRDELVEELRRAPSPNEATEIARNWQSGRPPRRARPGTVPTMPGPPSNAEPREDFDTAPQPPFTSNGGTSGPRPNLPASNQFPSNEPPLTPGVPEFEDEFDSGPLEPTTTDRPLPRVPDQSRPTDPDFMPRDDFPPIAEDNHEDAPDEPIDLRPRRQNLLRDIARIFSSGRDQQARKMTEIETALLGLPDNVAVGVLDDWLADLIGDDHDPDPLTDVKTLFDVRVARQLERRRIPPERLSREWQTKLERYYRH